MVALIDSRPEEVPTDSNEASEWPELFQERDLKRLYAKLRGVQIFKLNARKVAVPTDEIIEFYKAFANFINSPTTKPATISNVVSRLFRASDLYIFLLEQLEAPADVFGTRNRSYNAQNLWHVLLALPSPKDKLYPLIGGELIEKLDCSEAKRVRLIEKVWIRLLHQGVPHGVVLAVLRKLTDQIMNVVPQPELVGDFLVAFIEQKGTNYGLFAMNGIAKLMVEKSFAYPQFYDTLYKKLPALSTYPPSDTVPFMQSLERFMASPLIPVYVIAAFAKRLSRVALVSDFSLLQSIIACIRNMFAKHAIVQQMIHRDDPKTHDCDPFIDDSDTPIKDCRAVESSLWELLPLFRHWERSVAKSIKFADAFTKKLTAVDMPTLKSKEETFSAMFKQLPNEKQVKNVALTDPKLEGIRNWFEL